MSKEEIMETVWTDSFVEENNLAQNISILRTRRKISIKTRNPRRMPILAEGQYILLLRIEATDDKESDSDLAVLGVGNGIVHSGAVAGFPRPTLKFFVTGINEKIVVGRKRDCRFVGKFIG